MSENKENTTHITADEAKRRKSRTDFVRLDAMTEKDIAQAVADDPDAVPLDVDWTNARVSIPPGKEIVTLRLDRDMLDWFKKQGRGYQTRINAVLRAFYDAKGPRDRH